MSIEQRLIYASENGDRWLLMSGAFGEARVRHEPNRASGGLATEVTANEFLLRHAPGPQYDLLRLMLANDSASGASSNPSDHITPGLVRAARALLGWSQEKLAHEAHLDTDEVCAFEDGDHDLQGQRFQRLANALTLGGIVFIREGEASAGGPGVRMGMLGTSIGKPMETEALDGNDNDELGVENRASAQH